VVIWLEGAPMPGSRLSDSHPSDSHPSDSHLKAAEYFEGRAKRARAPEERLRFLSLVEKYRKLAGGTATFAEERPPAVPAEPALAAKGLRKRRTLSSRRK
jgi:hypothetical protein